MKGISIEEEAPCLKQPPENMTSFTGNDDKIQTFVAKLQLRKYVDNFLEQDYTSTWYGKDSTFGSLEILKVKP